MMFHLWANPSQAMLQWMDVDQSWYADQERVTGAGGSLDEATEYADYLAAQYHKDRDNTAPDWSRECVNCGQTPIVPMTGMCGPCTFGEADTAGGNW